MKCWSYGKTSHIKKHYITSKKKEENIVDVANEITKEIHDALLLSVDNPIDSWVLDSRASFHTIAHHEIMESYVSRNFRKVYLAYS